MTTPVIQHIGLSVHDIDKSTDWYVRMFDLAIVAEFDEPAPMKVLMTPDGQAIDLRQDAAVTPESFTQEHVGLDHVGFVCSSRAELDGWQRRLQAEGVMESGVVESPFG
jgi:catechol 2,3-dioxygenase-like lactoylglutathione lyase family enzyme